MQGKINKFVLNDFIPKQWVVYVKKAFSSLERVLVYLGHYTHRVAISNSCILKVENGRGTFRWLDFENNYIK